jgi:hypothetical protein
MVAFSSSTLVPQRRDEIIDRSQDLHLALPNPEVAPPELLAAEFVFAMLSLAASCARLGLVAAGIGCCIVGNPLRFDCEPSTSPLLARLLPATAVALVDVTLTCLRPGPANIGFEGLVVRGGLLRIDDCGVEPVVLRTEVDVCCCTCCCANALPWFAVRFTGDGTLGVEVDPVATERTRARRASSGMAERWLRGIFVMKGWFTASLGLRRRSGSQRRQREIKSMKASSSVLSACCKVLLLGRRLLPLLLTVTLGLPTESKNSFLRVHFSTRCLSGGPKISMMQASCSCSFSPGKMGYPVQSSARMQPNDHMSMPKP